MVFTHKGWFGLCPVYLNADEGEGMDVAARKPWLEWWFEANLFVWDVVDLVYQYINPEYEPKFVFSNVIKLDTPVETE